MQKWERTSYFHDIVFKSKKKEKKERKKEKKWVVSSSYAHLEIHAKQTWVVTIFHCSSYRPLICTSFNIVIVRLIRLENELTCFTGTLYRKSKRTLTRLRRRFVIIHRRYISYTRILQTPFMAFVFSSSPLPLCSSLHQVNTVSLISIKSFHHHFHIFRVFAPGGKEKRGKNQDTNVKVYRTFRSVQGQNGLYRISIPWLHSRTS